MLAGMASTNQKEACCVLDKAWLVTTLIKVLREHKCKPEGLKNWTEAQLQEVRSAVIPSL
jgi:hypothetical protein